MQNITLIGLSGSGKTTVGQLLAQTLGWRYVDTDHVIEQQTGQRVSDIFAAQGEAVFRTLEQAALRQVLSETHAVVATGGGIVEHTANRKQLRTCSFTVWLHASLPTLLERLSDAADRPLLAAGPAQALGQMAQRRAHLYAEAADLIVTTDTLAPQQVVDEIVRSYGLRQPVGDPHDLRVTTPGGSYPIHIAPDALTTLPGWLERLDLGGRLWLVSNDTVMPLHGERILSSLRSAGRDVQTFTIPDGEEHKNLATVQRVYDWLLQHKVERRDVILAFGGGVVGDLAGFVAATVLRGIAVVQLPTTVLATVDSAIGGKTGVDHRQGKNLIGAFHQPRLVLADTCLLQTLPRAERSAGWAEAIKHGVIGDAQLFEDLRQHAQAAVELTEPMTSALLRRAAAFKVRVVSGDEREQGSRILLNYGHTIGHAVEAASGYTLKHGEAIAIGMMAAGMIAERLGMFSAASLEAQRAVLRSFGLPTALPDMIDPAAVLERITSDKKVRSKRVRWVLPTAIGSAVVRDDVPDESVVDVLEELKN